MIEQEGQWVEKDLDAAFDGMMRASRMGLIEAKAALGFMYERGLGVPPDPDEALYWCERSATYGQGLLAARRITPRICYRIDRWYLHGDRDAQFMLGRMSETGTPSVPMDAEQALLWYEDAAVRGDRCFRASDCGDVGHSRCSGGPCLSLRMGSVGDDSFFGEGI